MFVYLSDPFSFDGPEIFKCKGCPIHWKPNKNLTVKTVKKKQKHKSKGNVRTITKQVRVSSLPPKSFEFSDENHIKLCLLSPAEIILLILIVI